MTICAQDRTCLFVEVVDSKIKLNDAGRLVQAAWDEIPMHYPIIEIDAFVVMPNHVHGIIMIANPVGAQFIAPEVLPPTNQGAMNRAPTVSDRHHQPMSEDTGCPDLATKLLRTHYSG